MAKQEQATLPGVPGPAKRKVIIALEELAETLDKQTGKRTKIGQDINETMTAIQAALVEHNIMVYPYEDSEGVERELAVKKRKAKTKGDSAKAAS